MGIGSLLLVTSAVALPAFGKALGARPFVWLGALSYSIYLLHRPLITLLAPHVLVPTILASKLIVVKGVTTASSFCLIGIVLVISTVLAIPFHRWVERPAITGGRRAATWLQRQLAPTAS